MVKKYFIVIACFFLFVCNTRAAADDCKIYFLPGWHYPGCGTVSATYGATVEEVARKEIAKQNQITNCESCRSPAIFISANEEEGTYVEESLCSGVRYTYVVIQNTCYEFNAGPPFCE